jgi:hypothetical protein
MAFGSCTPPKSASRATIAARELTPSLAKIRRKCVHTVHELMLRTAAMILCA